MAEEAVELGSGTQLTRCGCARMIVTQQAEELVEVLQPQVWELIGELPEVLAAVWEHWLRDVKQAWMVHHQDLPDGATSPW